MSEIIDPSTLKITQKIGWIILRPILKFFTGYRFSAECQIKDLRSPVIIISNHPSFIDPPIIGTVLPFFCKAYPVYFITKDALMTAPVLGGFLKFWGAFRAHRGEGLDIALKEPKRIMSADCSIVFFPQGGRKSEFLLEQGKQGAAALALQTETPILPAAICGVDQFSWKNFFLRRYKVRVKIGQPFLLSQKLEQNYCPGNTEVGTQIIMQEIKKMLE